MFRVISASGALREENQPTEAMESSRGEPRIMLPGLSQFPSSVPGGSDPAYPWLVDWSLVTIMGNTPPPRDPNDDDDEEEEEEEEEEEKDEDEESDDRPPVVREPEPDE